MVAKESGIMVPNLSVILSRMLELQKKYANVFINIPINELVLGIEQYEEDIANLRDAEEEYKLVLPGWNLPNPSDSDIDDAYGAISNLRDLLEIAKKPPQERNQILYEYFTDEPWRNEDAREQLLAAFIRAVGEETFPENDLNKLKSLAQHFEIAL